MYEAQYKWNREHPEKRREMSRNWHRKNTLSLGGGKHIRVKKRDYPVGNICELCGKAAKLLSYHHWDDEAPEFGLWLCTICHKIAEAVDAGIVSKYSQLKEEASKEVCRNILPPSMREMITV